MLPLLNDLAVRMSGDRERQHAQTLWQVVLQVDGTRQRRKRSSLMPGTWPANLWCPPRPFPRYDLHSAPVRTMRT